MNTGLTICAINAIRPSLIPCLPTSIHLSYKKYLTYREKLVPACGFAIIVTLLICGLMNVMFCIGVETNESAPVGDPLRFKRTEISAGLGGFIRALIDIRLPFTILQDIGQMIPRIQNERQRRTALHSFTTG